MCKALTYPSIIKKFGVLDLRRLQIGFKCQCNKGLCLASGSMTGDQDIEKQRGSTSSAKSRVNKAKLPRLRNDNTVQDVVLR